MPPAYLWVPEHFSTAGGEAIDLAASVGLVLDGEQRLAVDAILAEKSNGKWAAFEAGLAAARQNLKTFVFEVVVLADLYLFGSDLVVWTAHEFAIASEAFRDFKTLIEGAPFLSRRVRKITEANGDEGIEFHGGQRLRFKARTKTGGRGLTGDRTILDEAQELTAAMMGSLMPTMSARSVTGNPQILYGGSAGKTHSETWRGLRNRGRAGGDGSLVWIEWCSPVTECVDDRCDHRPGTPGCVLDDQEMWRRANPALDRRISREWIAGERRTMTPEEFARERLGWWEEPEHSAGGLPVHLWQGSALQGEADGSLLALAVDVTPESSWSSIGRAVGRGEGKVLEVAAHERGTGWVVAKVLELRGESGVPVVVDLAGPAAVLDQPLRDAGIEPVNPSSRDVATACAGLLDGLIRQTTWHRDQPELNAAVAGAVRGPLGDAWKWSRKSSLVDISPLVAVTLAAWVHKNARSVYEEREPVVL